MTDHDAFFQRQKPAAVLKHALLGEYLRVFTTMVGSTGHNPMWLIDGYAGPGSYGPAADDQHRVEGSPIVAMKVAQERRAKNQASLGCIFIDASKSNTKALIANLQSFVNEGLKPIVLTGTVQDQLDAALAHTGSSDPLVTFLDPFGVALPFQQMTSRLLPRTRKSEVLLNINVEAVSRLGGWLERRDGSIVPKQDQRGGVESVDQFFGDTTWRRRFLEVRETGNSAAQAAATVVADYRRKVEQQTGTISMSIPIRRAPHHPDLFHLTLFFRHHYAGYKFADAASRATRRWREAYRTQVWDDVYREEPSIFDDDETEEMKAANARRQEERLAEQATTTVLDNMRRLLTERGQIRVAHDVAEILGDVLSFAGESAIRSARKTLVAEGVLDPPGKNEKLYALTLTARR